MSRYYEYSYNNWEDCPFQGQIEVSAVDRPTRETEFKLVGGVFFKEKEKKAEEEVENEDLWCWLPYIYNMFTRLSLFYLFFHDKKEIKDIQLEEKLFLE